MSEFLGTDLDDATIQKIAKHCTFDNLKNVKSFDLSIRIKKFNDCLPFKIMRVSSYKLFQSCDVSCSKMNAEHFICCIWLFCIFKLFNPHIKTVARKTGGFMVSGKVGGWKNKLTILQGLDSAFRPNYWYHNGP